MTTDLDGVRVDTYPLPSIYEQTDLFTLRINGTEVPVTSFNPDPTTWPEYHYAHFSFDGEIVIEIITSENISGYSISPLALKIEGQVEQNRLTFTLKTSRYLIIKIDGYQELVLLADPIETDVPPAAGAAVFNVHTDFGADPTGATVSTQAIQGAIDEAAATGGGTIYVPPGVFTIGSLVLRTRTHLYLAGGAVLRATGDPADYRTMFRKDGLAMDGTWLISTEPGSSDISISGRGTVDGLGGWMRAEHRYLNHLIIPVGTTGFRVDGIIGRDAGLWALLPSRCRDVTILNYKGLQSLRQTENDALDINDCQDVTVRHCIAISEDDAYSTKSWADDTDLAVSWPRPSQPVERVLFEDVVAWTHCAAFKVGNGHFSHQRSITFRDGYVYNASRAIAVDPIYGAQPCSDITYQRIDVESLDHGKGIQTWLLINSRSRSGGIGPIIGVTVDDVVVRHRGASRPVIDAESSEGAIRDVNLRNVVVEGQPLRHHSQLGARPSDFVHEVTVLYDSSVPATAGYEDPQRS